MDLRDKSSHADSEALRSPVGLGNYLIANWGTLRPPLPTRYLSTLYTQAILYFLRSFSPSSVSLGLTTFRGLVANYVLTGNAVLRLGHAHDAGEHGGNLVYRLLTHKL